MIRENRAAEGGRRWAETIAANIRHQRLLREWSQQDVAERMAALDYPWSRATYSDVERHNRDVTFDELAALAMVYGVSPLVLLDPLGPRGDQAEPLTFGSELEAEIAAAWLAGRATIELVVPEDGSSPGIRTELHDEEALQVLGLYGKDSQ